MRRIEQLITEAKLSTNTTDIDSISSNLCQGYLNRIQSYMEDLLFLVNDENDLFIKDHTFSLTSGVDTYALPVDIYAKSSIDTTAVSYLTGNNQVFMPLDKISRKERSYRFGYFIQESDIIFSPIPRSILTMKISYQRKVPALGLRTGALTSAAGAGTVTIGALTTDTLTTVSDYFSTVDTDGVIVSYNNKITSYTLLTGVILFTAGTGTVSNSHYVIPGKYASCNSQLPDECEKYLITALERMIQYRQSSTDFRTSSIFTAEELETIKEVFADNSADDAKPPITEWQEWTP